MSPAVRRPPTHTIAGVFTDICNPVLLGTNAYDQVTHVGPPGPLLSPLASFIFLYHHVAMHSSLALCAMIQCREQPPPITPRVWSAA